MRGNQAPGAPQDTEIVRMMNAYGDILLRTCILYLQDADMARDAVQETFLKVYKKWNSFQGHSSELTWLTRIAINICKDMRRTAWFRLFDRRVSLDNLPEQAYQQAFTDDTVLCAIMQLPEKYKLTVILHYYQGLTQEETSHALNIPLSTVKTRLKRARERLHTSLKGWYQDGQLD